MYIVSPINAMARLNEYYNVPPLWNLGVLRYEPIMDVGYSLLRSFCVKTVFDSVNHIAVIEQYGVNYRSGVGCKV